MICMSDIFGKNITTNIRNILLKQIDKNEFYI